jgi:hypothetical protein
MLLNGRWQSMYGITPGPVQDIADRARLLDVPSPFSAQKRGGTGAA